MLRATKYIVSFLSFILFFSLFPLNGNSQDLILDGKDTTMYGEHIYENIRLINGSKINVAPWEDETQKGRLILKAKSIEVLSGSRINADGAGGETQGIGLDRIGLSTPGGGGAYGGDGTANPAGDDGQSAGKSYGSKNGNFILMGSKGGNATETAGLGGGAITIISNILIIHGSITANGFDGLIITHADGGGGSGGGILINSKNIMCSGSIEAKGGLGGGGIGGGGRIKIIYLTQNITGQITVSNDVGNPGTIWLNDYPKTPTLISPVNTIISDNIPTFQLKTIDESENRTLWYRIEVSKDTFRTVLSDYNQTLDQNGWSEASYTSDELAFYSPPSFFKGGIYQWRAYAYDGYVWSDGWDSFNPVPDNYSTFIVPVLVVKDSVKFGETAKDTLLNKTFYIKNNSPTELSVQDININNPQFSLLSDSSFVILPYDSAVVSLSFESPTYGEKAAELEIISDSETNPNQKVILKATILTPNLVVNNSFYLGSTAKHLQIDSLLNIQNESQVPLTITNITIDNPEFSFQGDPNFVIPANGSHNLEIRFVSASYGDKSAILRIFSDDPDNMEKQVGLNATVLAPKLEVSDNFFVGSIAKNLIKDSLLAIYNNSQVPLTISDITIDNPQFSLQSDSTFVIPAYTYGSINIRFVSATYGPKTATMKFFSDDPNNVQKNVYLSATVLAPKMIAVNSFFAGATIKNTAQDTIFTIQNDASVPLFVYGLAIDNPEFSIIGDTSLTINPHMVAEIQIRFLSGDYGQKSAVMQIFSDDPQNLSRNITLTATVIAPSLSVVSSFNLGSTAKNSPLNKTLFIKNRTIAPLSVWDLVSDNIEFKILSDSSFIIAGKDSAEILLQFESSEYGAKTATLSFKTDDPLNVSKTIVLTSVVLAPAIYSAMDSLIFGPLQRGFSKRMDLVLQNTTAVDLAITNIQIENNNFSFQGPSSFIIGPYSSYALAVEISSQNLGIENGTLSVESDDPDKPVIQTALKAEIREVDNTEPVVTNISIPTEVVSGGFNEIQVSVSASDNEELIKALCFYKGITDAVWDSVILEKSGDNYFATIPVSHFDEIGLEYFILLRDWVGNEKVTPTKVINLAYVNTGLINSSVSFGKKQENYQIISFPLLLDNKDIIGTLENDLGVYDERKWRLFQYQDGENIEVGKGLLNFEIGQGYWLIVKDEVTNIDSGPGKVVSVSSDSFFVNRLEAGWNQIGNPYNFELSWAKIKSFNNNDPAIGVYKTWEEQWIQTDRIKMFSGGFIFADNAFDLRIPPIKEQGTFAKNSEVDKFKTNKNNWEIPFTLNIADHIYTFAGFGMREDASVLKDPYDDMTLPRLPKYLEVNFYHKDYFYPKFTKDIVPVSENYIWDFVVESNLSGKKGYIEWQPCDFLGDKKLILLESERQKWIDMASASSYQFVLKKKRNFKVYYGDRDFINENLHPDKFTLSQNYPNPFNSNTYFEFTIPSSIGNPKVILSVYNTLGQKIKTIINSALSQGFYKFKWDGSGDIQNEIATGLYFYQLKVFDNQQLVFSKQNKMLYIK